MTELETKIKNFADSYYQGKEEISDSEYDALIEELRKENPSSSLLPENQGIAGSDLKGVSKKYKLDITMGTLAKCNSDAQFKEWWDKHNHSDLVTELKIDGNGAFLHYENGEFKYSRSRGNGEYGEDNTEKLKAIKIPLNISDDFSGNIRGEVVMTRTTFSTYFKGQKNPRNTAAGIMGRLGITDCDKLEFIAYDVFDNNNVFDKTEMAKISFLQKNNFQVPEYKQNLTFEEIVDWKNSLDTVNSEIPIDGIVIKQNVVSKEDLMRHTPLNNVAFKPNLQMAVSTLENISWQMKGRYLSPVAIITPVELEGTTVSRASLANISIIKKLGAYVGAKVYVKKSGMIIPQIVKVDNPNPSWINSNHPTNCPACNTFLTLNESGILECSNENCSLKSSHQIKKFLKVFGIKGAGDSFIKALEDDGKDLKWLINNCYNTDEKVLNTYAGGINGEKIFKQIKSLFAREISPSEFLAIFDAKLFDKKRLDLLGDRTLDELLSLNKSQILKVKGFSEITADAYLKFISEFSSEISELRNYFKFGTKEKKEMGDKTVVFTGTCPNYKRKDLMELAEKNGFIVQDSVTTKTNLLVCADPNSGSSKLQKAKKNGTEIMSYEEFLKNLAGD